MFYGQDLSEKVTSLNIYSQVAQVIYSVPIAAISNNSILQITAAFEATNPYPYNVMIGSNVILADSPIACLGVLLDPANAFNITPGNHHGVVVKARNWQSAYNYTNKYVNLVAWAASSNAAANDKLIIEQSYGHLDVYIA